MHLIDTSTFELHEFMGSDIPSYAVLSHRWTGQEVSFHDMKDKSGLVLPGFAKIKGCCSQAASEGWQYAWIDSCCIDKSSSAELTESINSMFQWYQKAEVCYAYLVDVRDDGEDPCVAESSFRESEWFRRGWTLQELIAPPIVVFFNCDWKEIGTKSSLFETIVDITGIKQLANIKKASVAQKMSWAATRQTTRLEDMAYCLMGLFNVHMPLLYGEGENAFRRLQLEILSNVDDETLFAWDTPYKGYIVWTGLLARSPYDFKTSGDICEFEYGTARSPCSMTNKGLRIELDLLEIEDVHSGHRFAEIPSRHRPYYFAPINAKREGSNTGLGIYLRKSEYGFERANSSMISARWNMDLKDRTIVHIKDRIDTSMAYLSSRSSGEDFLIRQLTSSKTHFMMTDCLKDEDGEKLMLHYKVNIHQEIEVRLDIDSGGYTSGGRYNYFLDHVSGAIMFSANEDVSFVLVFAASISGRSDIELLVPPKDQPFEKVMNDFFKEKAFHSVRGIPLDRATITIASGVVISARLRRMVHEGLRKSVIDLTAMET